jgi:hypothetical protein
VKQLTVKTELRSSIEDQVREFLDRGGAVQSVARGISGREDGNGSLPGFRSFSPRAKEERTYVPEVVAAIEARRKRPARPKGTRGKKAGAMRRAVFDDFGEPIRYEWVEPG